MKRAAVALVVAFAGVARAGDVFAPQPMLRTTLAEALPHGARLVDTRAIAGLGQAWRFAVPGPNTVVLLAADGAWWLAPDAVPTLRDGRDSSFDDFSAIETTLRVVVRQRGAALAIVARGHARVCFNGGADGEQPHCGERRPVSATLVCARAPALACWLE